MNPKRPNIAIAAYFSCMAILLAIMFYSAIAFPVFQWRNPKANSMTYYSEFGNVLMFQKMEKYQ